MDLTVYYPPCNLIFLPELIKKQYGQGITYYPHNAPEDNQRNVSRLKFCRYKFSDIVIILS